MKSTSIRIALFIVVFAVLSTVVYAHALLLSSSPRDKAVLKAAPKQIVLRFDARIEKKVSRVTLYDSDRKVIKLPRPAAGYTSGPPHSLIIPMPNLKPGSYRLEYRVLAADGHLTPGVINFTISGRNAS